VIISLTITLAKTQIMRSLMMVTEPKHVGALLM